VTYEKKEKRKKEEKKRRRNEMDDMNCGERGSAVKLTEGD
jgi:hypothetical protein